MPKQTNKDQLIKDIHTERSRLERNLSTLNVEEMIMPGVTGAWSVKDILAHLVVWERLLLDWYQTGIRGGSSDIEPVGMSQRAIEALNKHIYQQNHGRSLDDIIADFHLSFQQVTVIIEKIPEEDMFTNGRFSWTGRLTLADYIAGNTCNHYAWAKLQIRDWMKRRRELSSENTKEKRI